MKSRLAKMFTLILITTWVYVLFTVPLFAFQVDDSVSSWNDLINVVLGEYFKTVGGFTAGIIALSSALFTYILKDVSVPDWGKQLITFALALIGAILFWYLKLGVFSTMTIAGVIWTAINVSFGSNGIYSFFKKLLSRNKKE